jgi:hypothetical protein
VAIFCALLFNEVEGRNIWVEMALVESHVSALVADVLGEDVPVKLPAFKRVVDANRKSVREFAARVLPVLRVWCRQNEVSLPEPWAQAEAPIRNNGSIRRCLSGYSHILA